MKKRKEKVPQERKLFSNKHLIIMSFALAAIIILGVLLSSFLLPTQEVRFSLKAAIVDQIGEAYPSSPESTKKFNETATNILESAGFNVSYHKSESITVNFYKGLAKYNYGLIILRAHSALRKDQPIVDFFTSEKFEENKYPPKLITAGFFEWEKNVFYCAITPEFIRSIDGVFPKSIIIAMGCNSLNKTCTGMADVFIGKGAKVYVGWTGFVDLSHVDSETIKFLRNFLENETLSAAVGNTNVDPHYGSRMKYYPLEAGELTISSLIAEAESSPTHESAITLFDTIIVICIYRVKPKIEKKLLNLVYVKLAC